MKCNIRLLFILIFVSIAFPTMSVAYKKAICGNDKYICCYSKSWGGLFSSGGASLWAKQLNCNYISASNSDRCSPDEKVFSNEKPQPSASCKFQ